MVKNSSSRRSNATRASLVNIKDDLTERVGGTLAAGRASLNRLGSAARHQLDRADESVRGSPYIAMGIAAGTAVLLGFLLGRRCDR